MERIHCNKCGKSVSSEVPDDTIVRAWVECPECVAKSPDYEKQIARLETRVEELEGFKSTQREQLIPESFHPLTCGGNRNDEAHVAYQKEHGGDFGELVSTPNGLMCPVPGCGYKQNWKDDNEVELISWIRNVPHTKIVPLVQELIEMLVDQEMIGVREDGVPYHAHTGDLLI